MTPKNLTLIGALSAGAASGLLAASLFQAASENPTASPEHHTDNRFTESMTANAKPYRPGSEANSPADWQSQFAALRTDNRRLQQRLEELETRLDAIITQPAITGSDTDTDSPVQVEAQAADDQQPQPRQYPQTLTSLLQIGVDEQLARDLSRREDALEMQRLELRDQAVRDGSYGSASYRQKLQALRDQAPQIRDEIGDAAYDRYLYAMGRSNRVAVTSVMAGSPAEQAGLRAGDTILSYADKPIYTRGDLSDSTTAGERGEYVQIEILREGRSMSLLAPRGPLGLRMHSTRASPASG